MSPQAELCALIKSFEKPAYLSCVDCKARRLVWRYPVPPPGQFRCGHGCCLFPGRACSKGGWSESIDAEALFPATLFSVVAACEAAVKEQAQEVRDLDSNTRQTLRVAGQSWGCLVDDEAGCM